MDTARWGWSAMEEAFGTPGLTETSLWLVESLSRLVFIWTRHALSLVHRTTVYVCVGFRFVALTFIAHARMCHDVSQC